MYLIFVISFISLLMSFASKITKLIIPFVCGDSAEVKSLKREITQLRADLSRISMRDEYIKYVKCERTVVAYETQLNEAKGRDNARRVVFEYAIHYGGIAVLALCMMYISFSYRYSSIIMFGSNFNFEPFGGLINFPAKIPNSMSVVFWIVVNNCVARTIAGYVK